MSNLKNYSEFYLKSTQGSLINMKPLVQRNLTQRKKIYRVYKDELTLLRYKREKRISKSKCENMIEKIIEYITMIETIKIKDMGFYSRKEKYIKKLKILQKKVLSYKEYYEYLPDIMKAHTSLFRYAKDNKLEYSIPENGVDLMLLLISLYG